MEKNDNTNDKNIENQSEITSKSSVSDDTSTQTIENTTSEESIEAIVNEENNEVLENENVVSLDDSSEKISSSEENTPSEDNSVETEDDTTKVNTNDSASVSEEAKDTDKADDVAPVANTKSDSKKALNKHSSKQSESKEKHSNKNKKSNEKNRIIKTKKTPEYLPGMQKKLFVDVRDEDELTFADKIKRIFTDTHSICSILIHILMVANLIGITLFAKKCGLNITQSLLYKVHIDSLSFDTYTFLEISIIMSYIFAFIFGGLVTFAMVKIASLIAKNIGALYSHNLARIILGAFIVVFAIFTIISYINSGSLFTIATQNWLLPLSTFAGGMCMYCISLRNVEIY